LDRNGHDDSSAYAPNRAHDPAYAEGRRRIYRGDPTDRIGQNIGRPEENVGPTAVVPGRSVARRRVSPQFDVFGVLGRLALTASVVALVALVMPGRFPPLRETAGNDPNAAGTSSWPRFAGSTSATTEGPQRAAPRLAVTQVVPSGAHEDFPLGMSVQGGSDGVTLVITGLPTGSALSSGRPLGANSWRVSAADVDNTVIRLPRGFAGAMDLSVELRLPDETVAEHRSIRLARAPGATVDTRSADTRPVESQAGDAQTQSAAPFDLLQIDGATRIQQRLIELGFLSGAADGVWGPRSRNALRGFRLANRLGSDDTWDELTQRELFAASAAPVSAANQAGITDPIVETTMPSPPGGSRNPLNHSDALWIQRRLRDLGYYFGNDDAVWGAASRSALREFKGMNGLPDNDAWDTESEQRLSSDQNIRRGSIFVGRWGLDISQCQGVQDGSAPITISSHRAETVGGACDFQSVKREGANTWRIQALCSADGNSWNANISLKLSGSKLSWSSERGVTAYVRCPRKR
jgi:peptidoglycan hydrolase-like protein with peptidoglycan-binding domain